MTKNKYPHFNPGVYKIESKIAMVRTSHHCKFNINYHIIWIPKYRKPILVGKVREVLKTIIDGQCQELSLNNLALEIMSDHLHLFVGAKPTATPFKIIHKLKGNTSIQLRRVFPDLKYLGYKQHFGKGFDALWARGYYCGSAGHVSQEQVKRYIQEQMGKSVFEYDIYGCPTNLKGQLKIGDFTGI
ncbi:MAG TPA: IS200/IS605 family transposase [Candidatus Nanoarchaeia archaeon]|nr:IS200/IS605 family transposase [Candidatus Nanoarchaeia archaeon]